MRLANLVGQACGYARSYNWRHDRGVHDYGARGRDDVQAQQGRGFLKAKLP